jgi:hypothetical protein
MPVIFLDPRELVWLIFYGRTGGKKMRQKVIWTDAADDRLRDLRFAGLSRWQRNRNWGEIRYWSAVVASGRAAP